MRATLQKTENGYGLKEVVAFVSSVRPDHKHKKLSLKNCKTIEFGYDLEELAYETYPLKAVEIDETCAIDANVLSRKGFIEGFQKAVEILGDSKFSKSKLRAEMLNIALMEPLPNEHFEIFKNRKFNYVDTMDLKSLQQNEWAVEVEMENNTNQCDGCKAGHELDGHLHIDPKTGSRYMSCQKDKYQKPKLDADGCLILKRV